MAKSIRDQLTAVKEFLGRLTGQPAASERVPRVGKPVRTACDQGNEEASFRKYCQDAGVSAITHNPDDAAEPPAFRAYRKPVTGKASTSLTKGPRPPDRSKPACPDVLSAVAPGSALSTVVSPRIGQPEEEARRILEGVLSGRFQIPVKPIPMPQPAGRDRSYLDTGWLTDLRTPGRRKRRLVMGLDFGTAWSKVCIGDATASYPVAFFPRASGARKYLLPGTFRIDSRDRCHLGESGQDGEQCEGLKLALLERQTHADTWAKAIAFLALVMRYSRTWVLSAHQDTYQGLAIDWTVNVGLPTDSWQDSVLSDPYRQIALLAWRLSVEDKPVTMHRARELAACLKQAADIIGAHERGCPADAINVVPEFAAEVAGYTRSPQRKDDLHLLVDVGAGTVDITTFNVHGSAAAGGDILPVFGAKVVPMGTHYLMANRLVGNQNGANWCDADPVPTVNCLCADFACDPAVLRLRDQAFSNKLGEALWRVLYYTRQQRYPRSTRWQAGIPGFITGGGADVDLYGDVLARFKFLTREAFSTPSRLKVPGSDDHVFRRIAVAYGLSFGYDDLGETRPEGAVPDVPCPSGPSDDFRDRLISKDHV